MIFGFSFRLAAIVAVVILVIGWSAQSPAQDETRERLLACGGITEPTERMECFNELVESLNSGADALVAESPSATATTDDAPATRTPTAAATATATSATLSDPEPTAADPSSLATDDPGELAATPPIAAASVTAAATASMISATPSEAVSAAADSAPLATYNTAEPAATTAAAEENFGLEDANARAAKQKEEVEKKEEIRSIQATIVNAWPTVDGRFEVRLDNGQVWRETEGTRRMRLPKEGSSVVISKGRLGSYRMKIGNDNRLAAVRRTK